VSDVVIRAENLGKKYRIGEREPYVALRDVLARSLRAPARLFGGRRATASSNGDSTHIWALDDVSFEIRQGEVVGIIGRNGAGKSTLLKILARVTKPTRGFAEVRGRLGTLLEVGTGFHSELTGRENVFLSGAVLGMSKADIRRRFDEIVAFSEVGKFLDTPLKHYSSGMQMRLAFAVAAHLETEILLIDEVLAVGDANFQKKCLEKVGDIAKQGRTALFVSHSTAAVATLCKLGILLEHGRIKTFGHISDVVGQYLSTGAAAAATVHLSAWEHREGSGEVRISAISLRDHTGSPRDHFEYGDDLSFELTLEARRASPPLHCTVEIRTLLGVPVLHLYSVDDPTWSPLDVRSKAKVRCVLNGCDLYPGKYLVSAWLGSSPFTTIDIVRDVLQFEVSQGVLRRRGFDMNWSQGLVHRNSLWLATGDLDGPVVRLDSRRTVSLQRAGEHTQP
jgi:lipopolysaccharide transport system ATP-binding protein